MPKKILGFTVFGPSELKRDFQKIPGIFRKSPGFGIFFSVSGFLSPGFGIFLYFEISIPRIFAKSPGFKRNLQDSGFLPSGYPGDFLSSGSGFFVRLTFGLGLRAGKLKLQGVKKYERELVAYLFYFEYFPIFRIIHLIKR